MHVVYPSNPLQAKQPDEQFLAEVEAVRSVGFEISLFSMEDFQVGEFCAVPPLPTGVDVFYRGWMMSATEYEFLVSNLANAGDKPLSSIDDYLSSHHLPNWYSKIQDLTPETRILPRDCNLEAELRALAWPEYFIKDYVKSLKTSVGSRISKPEQVSTVVAEMQKYRGVIEGGFCIRRVENFLPDTERRYFVIDGEPHAATGVAAPIVRECAKRLSSRFYSVDVIERSDGQLRIVEVGDGQVSDLVGWTPEAFARILAKHFAGGSSA